MTYKHMEPKISFFLRLFVQYITKWAYICDYALIRWSTECKINLSGAECFNIQQKFLGYI